MGANAVAFLIGLIIGSVAGFLLGAVFFQFTMM